MTERVWVKKSEVECTGWACPSQWEGQTVEGTSIYIRYRWGYLRVESPFDSYEGKTLLGIQVGDDMDGVMDTLEMYEHTKDVIKWIDL